MKKNQKLTKALPTLGCLTVVVVVIVLVITMGWPMLKSAVGVDTSSATSSFDLIGSTVDATVEIGSVSDGIQLYGTVNPVQEASLTFGYGNATVSVVNVETGDTVAEGAVLVQVDTEDRENDVVQAKADLQDAEDELADLLSETSAETSQLKLEVELSEAQQQLAEDQAELAAFDAGEGTSTEDRERATETLAQAEATLDELVNSSDRQDQIDNLQWIYNQAEVKHGEMTVITNPSEQDSDKEWLLRIDMLEKQEALEKAQLQYEMDIAAAEHDVEVATRELAEINAEIALGSQSITRQKIVAAIMADEARIAQINASLTNLSEDEESSDIAEARAAVIKAEGALEEAQNALADSILVAPFAGTITQVNVSEDSEVSGGMTAVVIQDRTSLVLLAEVSEVDIVDIAAGDQVIITFDALSDIEVTGTIDELPLTGTYDSGVTTYEVPINMDTIPSTVKTGMSANILIPTGTIEDVLVVPAAAVYSDNSGDYVWIVDGNSLEQQYIETGYSDGLYTQVNEGLEEGQTIRYATQSYSSGY